MIAELAQDRARDAERKIANDLHRRALEDGIEVECQEIAFNDSYRFAEAGAQFRCEPRIHLDQSQSAHSGGC